jgi:hypothetical protein
MSIDDDKGRLSLPCRALGRSFRELQGGDIAARRFPVHAGVFTAKLGGAFVSHLERGGLNIGFAGDHQAAGLKKTKLLLILQRCHRRDGLELPMKGGGTHARGHGQIFYADRFTEPVSQIMDGLDDSSLMAIRHCRVDDLVAAGPGKKPVANLAHDARVQRGDGLWSSQKANAAQGTVCKLTPYIRYEGATRFLTAGRLQAHSKLFHHVLHDGAIKLNHKSQERLCRAGG